MDVMKNTTAEPLAMDSTEIPPPKGLQAISMQAANDIPAAGIPFAGLPTLTMEELKDQTRRRRRKMLRCDLFVGIVQLTMSLVSIILSERAIQLWMIPTFIASLSAGIVVMLSYSGMTSSSIAFLTSSCQIAMYCMILVDDTTSEGNKWTLWTCRCMTIAWYILGTGVLGVTIILSLVGLGSSRNAIPIVVIIVVIIITCLTCVSMYSSGCCSMAYTKARGWTVQQEYIDMYQRKLADEALDQIKNQENNELEQTYHESRKDERNEALGQSERQLGQQINTNLPGQDGGWGIVNWPIPSAPLLESSSGHNPYFDNHREAQGYRY